MEKGNSILVKSLRIYLIAVGIVFIIGLIIVSGKAVFSGNADISKVSFMGINLIMPSKEIIINPFIDKLIIILLGLLKASIVMAIIIYFYKFFENILELDVLSRENGKYLKMCGILLSSVTFLHVLQGTLISINMYNPIVNSPTVAKILLSILMFVLSLALHPLFWLGMFFILFGKIIDMATDVKQENDLTV